MGRTLPVSVKPLAFAGGFLLPAVVIAGSLFLNVATASVLLLGWLFSALLQNKSRIPAGGTPALLMLALAGWLTLAQFWSGVGSIGWFTTWIFLAIPLAWFGWQGHAGNHPEAWRAVQPYLAVLGCVLAGWGIAQVALLGQQRAMGPLADPNTYGCLLNLLWFPLLARFIAERPGRTVRLYGVSLVVIHLALMMSGSRTASLLWLLLCAVIVAAHWRSISSQRVFFICAMAVANYLVYSIYSSHLLLSSYEETLDQYSESPRLMMWLSTLRMWADAPWLGSGLGSWTYLYPAYRIPEETITAGYYAHNDYLQLLQEGGLFTFLIFAGVLGWLGFSAIRALVRLPAGAERTEKWGIVAGVSAATLHAAVNFTFYLIYINVLVGIYLGRLFQVQQGLNREEQGLSRSNSMRLKQMIILVLIAVNGFHALLSSAGLALLREGSLEAGFVHLTAPQLNQMSAAMLLASIRPSDSMAQKYYIASLESGIINDPFTMISPAAGGLLNEVVDGYGLLRNQNRYDAATPADEAGFLLAFDQRYGSTGHLQQARELLRESLRRDPSRAESTILLAETFFREGRSQHAFDLLAAFPRQAWNDRDRMLVEAEILKRRLPEHAEQLAALQQRLREMHVYCGKWKCGESYTQIKKSARQTLDSMATKLPLGQMQFAPAGTNR